MATFPCGASIRTPGPWGAASRCGWSSSVPGRGRRCASGSRPPPRTCWSARRPRSAACNCRQLAVGVAFERLEIGCRREMAVRDVEAHGADFGLRRGETRDRHRLGIQPGLGIAFVQMDGGVADHGREDDVRAGPLDLADHGQEVLSLGAQPQIGVAYHLAAFFAQEFAHDFVGFARVDVVRSHEVEAAPVFGDQIFAEREAILIGGRACIDHVRGIFEAFVEGRIP